MGKRRLARESALKTLFQVDVGKLSPDEALANARLVGDSDPEVLEFAERLARGALAHQERLDAIISRYATGWALDRMANVDRNLLRLALFEILFLDDIPASVSINEAVDLAKLYSTADSGRFINGILGNFVRQEGAPGADESAPGPGRAETPEEA